MHVLANGSQSIQRTNDKKSMKRRRTKLPRQDNYVDDFIERRSCDLKSNSASFDLILLICFKISVTFITFSTSMSRDEFYQPLFVCLLTTSSKDEVVTLSRVAILKRLLFPSISQQVRRRETNIVHSRFFPINQILFSKFFTFLFHIFFLQDFFFSTLLFVNNRRSKERMLTTHFVDAFMLIFKF